MHYKTKPLVKKKIPETKFLLFTLMRKAVRNTKAKWLTQGYMRRTLDYTL